MIARFCSGFSSSPELGDQNSRDCRSGDVARAAILKPWNSDRTKLLEPFGTLWNLWNPVDGANRRPRPTPQYAFRGEIAAVDDAVLADGFLAVVAARRREPALNAELCVEG